MRTTRFVLAAALGAAACSSSNSTGGGGTTCTGSTIVVPSLGVQTVSQADAPCVSMPADGSTYIVVPQFASGTGSTSSVTYEIGTAPPAAQDRVPWVSPPNLQRLSPTTRPHGLREQFDAMLRARERELAKTHVPRRALPPGVAAGGSPPTVGDTGFFWVCGDLNCTTFKKDTSIAKYVGGHIAIFLSIDAPGGGLSAGDISALGATFDTDLYPIDVNTFGPPSDIDLNTVVEVLLTPKVNAMTPSSQCATQGYVAGFFFGLDLEPAQAHSNGAEIFYSIVPDPGGIFSCAHQTAAVKSTVLATFIHEFQHMISWNWHVIVNNGPSEDVWLNEGLSHIAEEMGSRYYEHKYPPPTGRSDPSQLFPDSAEGFIGGDITNAYSYLTSSSTTSATIFANAGSLEERGAAWLFLRWLGDLKDSTIYKAMEQTVLTGTGNVAAHAGETFPSLFGDYSMAVYTDSLVGLPKASAPARDRFVSRNLRQIFQRLFDTSSEPAPWPFVLTDVPISGKTSSSMVVGTMDFWKVTMPASGSEMRLLFTSGSGGSFPASDSAQLTVFHCASAGTCP